MGVGALWVSTSKASMPQKWPYRVFRISGVVGCSELDDKATLRDMNADRLCYCEKAGIRFLGAVPSKAVTTRVTTTSM